MLHTFSATAGDQLAGYITVLAPELPHYSAVVAVAESFFVDKASLERPSLGKFQRFELRIDQSENLIGLGSRADDLRSIAAEVSLRRRIGSGEV